MKCGFKFLGEKTGKIAVAWGIGDRKILVPGCGRSHAVASINCSMIMWRVGKLFGGICLVFACVAAAQGADEQEEIFLRGNSGKGPLTAAMKGTNVVLSWPAQPGSWKLMSQAPANTGEWTPVAIPFHTNAATVSVTMPVPTQTTLYKMVRTFTRRKAPPLLPPAPLPTSSTNRPPKPPAPN